MRLRLGLPLIVSILLFAGTVSAQEGADVRYGESVAGITDVKRVSLGDTVRGEIVEALYEFPIEDVRVVLQAQDGTEYTTTAEYGNYEFRGIPAGRYLLSIHKKGYHDRIGKPVTIVKGSNHYLPLKMVEMDSLLTGFRRLLIYILLLCGITALITFSLTKRWMAARLRSYPVTEPRNVSKLHFSVSSPFESPIPKRSRPMTRKTLVSILILTLCTIILISPEPAETQEPPTEHNGAEHSQTTDAIEQGKEKLLKGDYAGAIADFESVLERVPEDPDAYYYRASAKFEWGKSEQGTGNVEQAKRLYHAAIQDYTQVITLDPQHPGSYIWGSTVHLRLADLERTVGDSQQARHHFQAAHEMVRYLTDVAPGTALVWRYRGAAWRTRGTANHNLGILAANTGDRDQAQRHYEAGIEDYNQAVAIGRRYIPENPWAYADRGAVRCSFGLLEMVRDRIEQAQLHYESAIADQEQAVHHSLPESAIIFSMNLSRVRVKLGASEVALGNIQAAQQHYRAAIAVFDEAIGREIGADLVGIVYNDRAEAKLRLGESETLLGNVSQAEQLYREAIANCDHVLTLEMNKVKAFYTRGRAKAALADYRGAISDFETAIRIKSDHALAYYARGLAKQARGGNDTGDGITAEADFQKARTLKPDVEKLYAFGIGGGK